MEGLGFVKALLGEDLKQLEIADDNGPLGERLSLVVRCVLGHEVQQLAHQGLVAAKVVVSRDIAGAESSALEGSIVLEQEGDGFQVSHSEGLAQQLEAPHAGAAGPQLQDGLV